MLAASRYPLALTRFPGQGASLRRPSCDGPFPRSPSPTTRGRNRKSSMIRESDESRDRPGPVRLPPEYVEPLLLAHGLDPAARGGLRPGQPHDAEVARHDDLANLQ